MHIFQIFTYAGIVHTLQQGYPVPEFFLSDNEWNQLHSYMPLQNENGMIYAPCLTVPGFQMSEPDEKGVSSEKGDRLFEDTREHMFRNGKLKI